MPKTEMIEEQEEIEVVKKETYNDQLNIQS